MLSERHWSQWAFLSGVINAFLAVALGAFGAHALRSRVTPDLLSIWQTAVQYQFYHALALILLGLWMRQYAVVMVMPTICFLAGILLFSGSLYALVLSGIKIVGMITPLGGLLFLLGWIAWGVAIMRKV